MKMMKPSLSSSAKAFSLIEVTLAIGVVSFAVVSILGTLSVGLTTIKDAKKDVTHAQIISQISSSVYQSPFDQLEAFASNGPFFFDQAGRQLDSSNNALYRATLAVSAGTASTYPGAQSVTNAAKTVSIAITPLLGGATNAGASSRAAFLVPKS